MPTFRALRVHENQDGTFSRQIEERQTQDLPEGEVLVRVHYAGLNYKDALSATGNKGVTRRYPHTPGIDAAGVVAESQHEDLAEGDEVIVTSYDLGMNTDGGFAEYIRVPADWIVPKPKALSLKQSMILGTAGFTAGLGLYKMLQNGQAPEQGKILVTGATGGVGSMAVGILAKAGFEVIASTGKASAHDYLTALGASEIVSREAVQEDSKRPLLKPRWAGAIDTVGGNTLETVLKACKRHGSVAACGLVLSPKLNTSVFPFILNGINLLGIDSERCTMPVRRDIWDRLASDWRIPMLDEAGSLITLDELDEQIDRILKGKVRGRIVVEHEAAKS